MESKNEERLFVAIDIPAPLKKKVVSLQDGLKRTGAKIVDSDNLHVTLCFIGEVSQKDVKSALELLKRVNFRRSYVDIRGVNAFPNNFRPQVIFLRVLRDESLRQLSNELYTLFRIKPDYKDFKSHLTIARFRGGVKAKIRNFIIDNKDTEIGSFLVDRVSLYSSKLTSSGPVYKKLGEVRAIDSL